MFSIVVSNVTCLTASDRGSRNSSRQSAKCTPVIVRSLEHHTDDTRKTAVHLVNVPWQTVSDVIYRFKELRNDSRRPGSGQKRTVNSARNRKAIEKRIHRNTRVFVRQIGCDMEISDRSVRRITKSELGLKPYNLRKVQLLTEKNKLVRLRRCRKLLRRAASQRWERFLFTDEKLFIVQQVHITPKTIESGVWTLRPPRQLLNIANIQSRSQWRTQGGESWGSRPPKALDFFPIDYNYKYIVRKI
ncbi:uncharacterized protein TNCV_2300971 [Trichonephila clavipes]|nr:uncharacterized protein TNCV_2300971 [Trichonephila clavipes]